MLNSHIFVIADTHNVDRNGIADIAAAIQDCGAIDLEYSENGVIEATLPTQGIADIARMEGVVNIRTQMTYDANFPLWSESEGAD